MRDPKNSAVRLFNYLMIKRKFKKKLGNSQKPVDDFFLSETF